MFKIGDKVARRGSPNVLMGYVEAFFELSAGLPAIRVRAVANDERCGVACFRLDGKILANCGAKEDNMDVVPYVEPKKEPIYLAIGRSGVHLRGDEITSNMILGGSLLVQGDKIYKYVGEIKNVAITEEEIPIEPGYSWNENTIGGEWSNQVIAVHEDYAFVQSYRNGVAGGCSAVRISSIPKQKRPCKKTVKQLVKE